MNKDTVQSKTLKHDLCINCGICEVSCLNNAIKMKRNKYCELNPVIDYKKCTDCGLCSKYCPNTKTALKEEAVKVTFIEEPQAFGLENSSYYLAWSKDLKLHQSCCSGGVVTELAKYLLSASKIDGMVHVERLWAKRGELHYGARLSTGINEIVENVSSAYQPIDFSEVLEKLKKDKTYFITGTPCVIRGLKKLFAEHSKFRNIKIITCALVCSHTTNAQVMDFLTEIHNLDNSKPYKINIRNKDNIPDANNFNNHIYTEEKDLLKMNRFESHWTDIWRSYYFAMNVCNYCSDFWGYEADISVKDAWSIEWAKDPLGKSVVVIRNKELENLFKESNIEYEAIPYEIMKNHQISTSCYKQVEAKNKNFKSMFSRSNRRNGLLKNKLIAKSSKFLYKNFGYKTSKRVLKRMNKILSPKIKKPHKPIK
ncbi:MAG: Coenzyme F420 hydrogenase/dehydrogenase, beta subunit C-terminal domain, partial [Candidatus Gastranaerophilales bacterium]|nr:Coenzyme F420 hydrogenase/dehydrogenase, beta subunit C-terminal domain [Candidatus Gastranaerophilales bacterium]